MKKVDWFDLLAFIIFKLILDAIYVNFQNSLYGYYGFLYNLDANKCLISWVIYIFSTFFIQNKDKGITTVFIYTVFLLGITPCFVYFEYNPECEIWMLLCQVIPIAIMNLLFKLRKEKNGIHLKTSLVYNSNTSYIFIAVILSVYTVYMLIKFGFPSLDSFLFSNVYDTRAQYEATTALSIIQNIICKIICPLYIYISLKEKKWGFFVFLILVQLYSYGITGFKTYLFIPLIILAVSLIPKLNLKKCIVIGLPLVTVVSIILYTITGNLMIYAIFIERVIFLPAKIKFCYFDFFSSHDFAYFTQSSLANIFGISSNYSTNIPNMIGEIYFNKPGMWTNTGFIADAYSNLGYIGIFLICTIMYFVLMFTRDCMGKIPENIGKGIQAVFLLFFISLNDGGAISVLFSGGMLMLVFIVMLVNFNPQKDRLNLISKV